MFPVRSFCLHIWQIHHRGMIMFDLACEINSRRLLHLAIAFCALARLHILTIACHPKFKVVQLQA